MRTGLCGRHCATRAAEKCVIEKEWRYTQLARLELIENVVGIIRPVIIAYSRMIATDDEVRNSIEADGGQFIEVYAKCPIEVLAERDAKGLYRKALAGEIKEFTGVSDPYEAPLEADVVVETDRESIKESTGRIMRELNRRGLLRLGERDIPFKHNEEHQSLS